MISDGQKAYGAFDAPLYEYYSYTYFRKTCYNSFLISMNYSTFMAYLKYHYKFIMDITMTSTLEIFFMRMPIE